MDVNETMNKSGQAMETASRMAESAKNKFSEVSNQVMEKSRVAASTTDSYVREYAWSSIALAALLGVVVGLMIRRH
jgi:ElaB/YqjD/DUF883 family membrane-anchored ribosome-binding protein